MTAVTYQPLLPVVAVWSLEFIQAIGVIFVQEDGTDVNVIGSRLWSFPSVAIAIAELQDFPWRKRIETHVIPPDPDSTWINLFDEAGLDVEQCPAAGGAQTTYLTRELFPVLSVDIEERPWEPHDNNNAELMESINGYRVEKTRQSETFSSTPARSWEAYLVRALEVYALWRNAHGAPGWAGKPDLSVYNAGVI